MSSSSPEMPPQASSSSSSSRPSSSAPSTPFYPASLSLSHSHERSPHATAATNAASASTEPRPPSNHRHHSRRPSRAERYEHLVENARETLQKSRRSSGILVDGDVARRRSSYISLGSTTTNGITANPGGKRGSLSLIGERLGLGELGHLDDDDDNDKPTTRSQVGLGLGIQHDPDQAADEQAKGLRVHEREWRETVRNLLIVVDGMSQQLATHDELAAQLKIAQSNLTLAETHSEFLEETLRRRETSTGSSQVRNSTSMQRNGRSRTAEDGEVDEPNPASSSSSGGARSFFRLPTTSSSTTSSTGANSGKRKATIPPTPLSFVSAHSTPALRSVASSPRLGQSTRSGNESPTMPAAGTSPPDPRFSTLTVASFDSTLRPGLVPNPSTQSLPNPPSSCSPSAAAPSLLQDFNSLQSAYRGLESECAALKVNEESLKRNNDMMVKKCADLEKTKDDLMSELENLSVELFSEANALVAEERRARATAEAKIEQLQAELNSLSRELESLRAALALARQASQPPRVGDATSPDLPAIPRSQSIAATGHSPLSLLIPSRSSSSSSSPNPNYSPSLVETPSVPHQPPTTAERPTSTASVVSTGRKWFSFGRSPSIPAPAPSPSAGTDSTASPNPSFSTPPLPNSSLTAAAPNGSIASSRTTPSLSLSPYLDQNPLAESASPELVAPRESNAGLGIPMGSGGGPQMERSNSGSSFVTARTESWFGFGGGGNRESAMTEEPREIQAATPDGVDRELEREREETLQTPVRSTFASGPASGAGAEGAAGANSPRPPKKEVSPRRDTPARPVSPPPSKRNDHARAPSPSPSQATVASTIASSNKDLPAKVASPPLPPLPPATPLASALSSPTLADGVETDPMKLPFSTTTTTTSTSSPPPPVVAVKTRPNRSSPGTRVPRPLAIHIAASSSSSSSSASISNQIRSPSSASYLSCPSPSSTTSATPAAVGGPSQREMTAGARSPKSPNDLRWKEAVSSIVQPSSALQSSTAAGQVRTPTTPTWSSSVRQRTPSGDTTTTTTSGNGAVVEKETFPPSRFDAKSKDRVLPQGPPPRSRAEVIGVEPGDSRKPLPPTTRDKDVPSIPPKQSSRWGLSSAGGGGLRIDTGGAVDPTTSSSGSVTPRPTERGPRSARPPSTSSNSLGSKPGLFRHHSTTNASSSSSSSATPAGGPLTGSFGSNSSISSHASSSSADASTTATRSTLLSGFKGSKGGKSTRQSAVPLSPDGTKAVDDLEKLMESMMDMFE